MEQNVFSFFIPIVLVSSFIFNLFVEFLNLKSITPQVPDEMKDVFEEEKYQKSQAYLKENTVFSLINSGVNLVLILLAIYSGLIGILDNIIRSFGASEIANGMLFIFIILTINQLLSIPFSAYATFVIEQKYGFNKQTPKIFISDQIKSYLITLLIGLPVFALVIFLFQQFGKQAWVLVWVSISLIQLLIAFVAPTVLMPLFNKFSPLAEGKLKKEIERFSKKQNFKLGGIFVMDGSKRSTKSNAFFTGFGKFKRIALFDTLIKNHTVPEIVAVLAHEIGHYKKKHIIKIYLLSFLAMGLSLYLFSKFINSPEIFFAIKVQTPSIYVSLLIFGLVFGPISSVFGIVENYFSRKFEYEADSFAIKKYGHNKSFIYALKKLSATNLSNLTPHRLKIIMDYSHPPILERIAKLKK